MYCCGPRSGPAALLASYDVDLVTIRDFDRQVIAARAPKHDSEVDVFAPGQVVWAYEDPAEPTLQALLDLVPPDHPDAPHGAFPAPGALHVPRHDQRPMTIRLPTPDRAGCRAARLGAGLLVPTPDGATAHREAPAG